MVAPNTALQGTLCLLRRLRAPELRRWISKGACEVRNYLAQALFLAYSPFDEQQES